MSVQIVNIIGGAGSGKSSFVLALLEGNTSRCFYKWANDPMMADWDRKWQFYENQPYACFDSVDRGFDEMERRQWLRVLNAPVPLANGRPLERLKYVFLLSTEPLAPDLFPTIECPVPLHVRESISEAWAYLHEKNEAHRRWKEGATKRAKKNA